MNTFARQSISKTLVKACTAAVLLVTCFNAQAADSDVQNLSNTFRAEVMQTIKAEQNSKEIFAPTLDLMNSALEKASQTEAYRNETFASMQVENTNIHKPSLNILDVALNNFEIFESNVTNKNAFVETNTRSALEAIWANNIQPQFASLDTLKLETNEVARQEATVIAIDVVIKALETARINFIESNNYSL